MTTDVDTVDKYAWYLSGALVLLGIVVGGIVEILAGKPYGAVPLKNDAGKVVATPAVDPGIRTGLVLLGLLVLLGWGVYKMATPELPGERTTTTTETTAD